MHLGQVKPDGAATAAVFEEGMASGSGLAQPIPGHNMLDLIRRGEAQNIPLGKLAAQIASRHPEELAPVLPIYPPEVWACGCT